MQRSHAFDPRRAEQLHAFAESVFSGGDPQAARLMDQLRRVAHQMLRLGETGLQEAGISYAQYRVLWSLLFEEWLGNRDGLNPSSISEQQGTGRNTVSALIRGLEDHGLIERRLDDNDRRRFNIVLTEAGRQRVRQQAAQHMQFVDKMFADFTPDERETFSNLLAKLNHCAQNYKGHEAPSSGGIHANRE